MYLLIIKTRDPQYVGIPDLTKESIVKGIDSLYGKDFVKEYTDDEGVIYEAGDLHAMFRDVLEWTYVYVDIIPFMIV